MFKVANVVFEVLNVKNEQMLSGLEAFRTNNEKADVVYHLIYVDDFKNIDVKKNIYVNDQVVVQQLQDGYRYIYFVGDGIYAIVEEHKEYADILLRRDMLQEHYHRYFLPGLLGLERYIIERNAFAFHSSYIAVDGQAILFSAPSGGGKSTQADLWKKYRNAKILNGDRNIVGRDGKGWCVYGTPFSGSSEYCVNQKTPLHAIVMLEKGPVNIVTRMDMRGFRKVFSQVTVNPWNQEFCAHVMNLVMQVCADIPVYFYSCTKEKNAVSDLYEILVEDGALDGTRK